MAVCTITPYSKIQININILVRGHAYTQEMHDIVQRMAELWLDGCLHGDGENLLMTLELEASERTLVLF